MSCLSLAVAFLLLFSSRAFAVEDILVRNALGESCVEIEVGGSGEDLFVYGYYDDALDDGVRGAQFRIAGLPQDWIVAVTPNPQANLVLGDPFQGGVDIAFPSCAMGANNEVLLYTVTVLPTTGDVATLEVEEHTFPLSPNFPCPLFFWCIDLFGGRCVQEGVRAVINGGVAPCVVAVEQASWAEVKALYR